MTILISPGLTVTKPLSVSFVSESQNMSFLSDMTSQIWGNFAKDWHKIGILQ